MDVLSYASPRTVAGWVRPMVLSLVGAVIAVVIAGMASTAALTYFRFQESTQVLAGLPRARLYGMLIDTVPGLLGTLLLAGTWAWGVWRCPRPDRLLVGAVIAAFDMVLWWVMAFWIVCNGYSAFP